MNVKQGTPEQLAIFPFRMQQLADEIKSNEGDIMTLEKDIKQANIQEQQAFAQMCMCYILSTIILFIIDIDANLVNASERLAMAKDRLKEEEKIAECQKHGQITNLNGHSTVVEIFDVDTGAKLKIKSLLETKYLNHSGSTNIGSNMNVAYTSFGIEQGMNIILT